ncbi:zinc ribbon domain-containing protein [Candidatus Solincola tengchongensis]|uniref:FmdB family zinc ribbon protein n=1 Tax=Candidatus Solincola tengchongensis TaxID=2900693 RepID=UPI00257BDF53|nr:zinc ribbon domain-containing protein [Candidatus Solincola tengchongensis]
MPIFEYRCEECGHRFDAFFRRSEDAEKETPHCDRCGSGRVRKLFSLLGWGGGSGQGLSGGCATRST